MEKLIAFTMITASLLVSIYTVNMMTRISPAVTAVVSAMAVR